MQFSTKQGLKRAGYASVFTLAFGLAAAGAIKCGYDAFIEPNKLGAPHVSHQVGMKPLGMDIDPYQLLYSAMFTAGAVGFAFKMASNADRARRHFNGELTYLYPDRARQPG